MLIVNVLGFAAVSCWLSLHYKEKINTVVQTALGIWMMLLYCLALFQKLSWIDWVSMALIFALLFYVWKNHLQIKNIVMELADGPAILFVATVVILSFLVKDKMVVNFDELGVWGPEPKCLYMLDGFADKYMNLLSGYSAYNPGAMLIEWWTCHFSPNQFNEGLLYVGAWFIILCCVAPAFEKVNVNRKWALVLSLPASVLLILLPSMYGKMNYFLIAEMPMSMIFVGCLLACFDNRKHDRQFRFLRFTINLACLMLVKESGIVFAAFVLLFYFLMNGLRNEGKWNLSRIIFGVGGFLIALIPVVVWREYCALYERNNYFEYAIDGTVNSIKTQTFTLSNDLPGYASSMLKAWIGQPLHVETTCGWDLTPLMAALLVLALCWCCVKISVFSKECAVRFSVLYVGFLVVYMMMLLFMHAYVFGEGQYLQPEKMVYTVGRYTEPLFLGGFVYFVTLILRDAEKKRLQIKKWLAVASIILLCSDMGLAKAYMFDYAEVNSQMADTQNQVMSQESVSNFVDEVEKHFGEKDQARILWISDKEDVLVKMGQTRVFLYMFAPKTYSYCQVNQEAQNPGELMELVKQQVEQQHFGYVYFDFTDSGKWSMSETQMVQNQSMYRILLMDDGTIHLENMDDQI